MIENRFYVIDFIFGYEFGLKPTLTYVGQGIGVSLVDEEASVESHLRIDNIE